MSGVTGNEQINSRKNFREILRYAKNFISAFPGFISLSPTGSYVSNKSKTSFGDMDLVATIDGTLYNNDKKKAKAELAKYFVSQSDKIVVPFISDKYVGKRYYNSGEIITISLQTTNPTILACQIDFIVAMNKEEADFKINFLNMPANKQGIILGLIKTVLIEHTPNSVFKRLNINANTENIDKKIQEYEFNLSSKEIQLRLVTYDKPDSFKQKTREIVWSSDNWSDLQNILSEYDLDLSFDKLIKEAKNKLKKTRSSKRISGVFKSMISIKSGEVNKQKGIDKQNSLDKVHRIFGESISGKSGPLRKLIKENYINEANTLGVFAGRFEPLTKAHTDIITNISNDNKAGIVFLIKGKETSKDKSRNPFSLETQKNMLEKILPKNIKVKVIQTAYFIDELMKLPEIINGTYKHIILSAGSDRVKQYKRFADYLDDDMTLSVKEIKRTDDDISGTKVREAIKNDNIDDFNKFTDSRIHSMYNELKEEINK